MTGTLKERLKEEIRQYIDLKAHTPRLHSDALERIELLELDNDTLRKGLENHGEECAAIQRTMARIKAKG